MESTEYNRREPTLRVSNFSKMYEGTRAVHNLSFDAFGGEILGLVGPNGAGKTTTLRSIAGILPIKDGNITIGGYDITSQEELAKRRLAWVPDDPQPFDSLTVMEHLEFTAALYHVPDWRNRAEQLLTKFELFEKQDALGGELSRGMRQKLSFSCAWLAGPSLVLLDEPLTGLDPRGIRSAKQSIVDLAASGTAVLLSSHLLELVQELAHRILIINRGEKVFLGTMTEARATIQKGENATLEEIFMAATEGAPATPGDPQTPAGGPTPANSIQSNPG